MAVLLDNAEYGAATFGYANTPNLGVRQFRFQTSGSISYGDAHIAVTGTALSFGIVEESTGVPPNNNANWVAILVEDGADLSGNYMNAAGTALSAGVVCVVELGADQNVLANTGGGITFGNGSDPAGAGRSINPPIAKRGTYRVVIAVGQNPTTNPPTLASFQLAVNASNVSTGPTSTQSHLDSDGNVVRGGANVIMSTIITRILGWAGKRGRLPAAGLVTPDNQEYGQSHAFTLNLDGTFANPKSVAVALSLNASGATPVKARSVALNVNGDGVSSTYNVDNQLAAAPTDYYLHVGVNNTLGNATTPADQLPHLGGATTITGLTTSQRAWLLFEDNHDAAYTHVSDNQVRDAGANTISSAIPVYQDAGLTVPGVATYSESARTNFNRLFNIRQGASLDGPHGRVYFRCYLADGYGNALPNTDVQMQVLDATGTVEQTINLTSGAGGVLTWDRQCAATDARFVRFLKTGASDPDALSANEILIPQADIHKPAGTKANQYQDPKLPLMVRDFSADQPGRAKDVRVTGREYGANEPTNLTENVFAVSGEIIIEGMVTCDTTETDTDANGVPTTLAVIRGKVTAAGGMIAKTASLVNESTFRVDDPAAHNVTDIAGRPFAWAGGFEISMRRALFDRGATIPGPLDTGTNLAAQQNLEGPLGYSQHSNDAQEWDNIDPPSTNATTLGYYQAAATEGATLNSFSLSAGSTEIPGFTVNSGLMGYKQQVVIFRIIDPSLKAAHVLTPRIAIAGETVRGKMHGYKSLPDQSEAPKSFDGPPVVRVRKNNAAGVPMSTVQTIFATPIGAQPTEDYEYELTAPMLSNPNVSESYTIDGAGLISGAEVAIPAVGLTVDRDASLTAQILYFNLTRLGKPWRLGDPLLILYSQQRGPDTVTPDPDSGFCDVFVIRNSGDVQYLDSLGEFQTGTPPARQHQMVASGDSFTFTAFDTSDWGEGYYFVQCDLDVGGFTYTALIGFFPARDDALRLVGDVGHADSANNDDHLRGGLPIEFVAQCAGIEELTFHDLDTDPAPGVIIFRKIGAGTTEYWDDSLKDWVSAFVPGGFVINPLTIEADGKTARLTVAAEDTATWGSSDVEALFVIYKDKLPYYDRVIRELTGDGHLHGDPDSGGSPSVDSLAALHGNIGQH